MWWEPAFALYWGLVIKFVNPCLLYFIVVGILKNDISKPYGAYSAGWQVIGWAIPFIGMAIFIIGLFMRSDEELDYTEFELYGAESSSKTGESAQVADAGGEKADAGDGGGGE